MNNNKINSTKDDTEQTDANIVNVEKKVKPEEEKQILLQVEVQGNTTVQLPQNFVELEAVVLLNYTKLSKMSNLVDIFN